MPASNGPVPELDGRALTRLTPERVRSATFPRAPLGRRGVDEEEIRRFLIRVAEDLAARDNAEANLRAENSRIKEHLVRWQSEQANRRNARLGPQGPSIEAVNAMSRAQQQADAFMAQAQDYARRVTTHAREQADSILRDAHDRAERAAEEAAQDYRHRAGEGYTAEVEEMQRRVAYLRAFGHTMQVQLHAAAQAFMNEVDKIATEPLTSQGNRS
jgi:cell division septum initiation protein DivIVA